MEEKEFEYKEEYAWPTSLCLNVTDDCNLKCKYCFVEQNPHYMSYEIAKQSVAFLLNNLNCKKEKKIIKEDAKAHLTYFGGEPTLMWDEIIVPLTMYIRKNDFPITISITTNGTLLNQEKIEFLKKYQIIPLLSIDGNEQTQNFNRPCKNSKQRSFDLVNKNIPLLLENFPETTFRSTIYSHTVNNLFENYLFAISKGFKNIFFCPDSRSCWSDEQKKILKLEVDKIFNFQYFCFNNNISLPIRCKKFDEMFEVMIKHDWAILNNNVLDSNIIRSVNRCGLGTLGVSIGYNGKIYGCQEQTSKEKDLFLIGDLKQGIDQTLHFELLKEYSKKGKRFSENKKLCETCLLRNNCQMFGCPSTSYDLYKNFLISSEIDCLWHQYIFENSILLNNILVQQNNLLFKDYIESIIYKMR